MKGMLARISPPHSPGQKDGVMEEILKDLPVLGFLLLSLLLCFSLWAFAARSFLPARPLRLGGFRGFFGIYGPISVSPNRDFILEGKREEEEEEEEKR